MAEMGTGPNLTIREYPQEEFEADLREEMKRRGLHMAVCERINEITEALPGDMRYPLWGFITYKLEEIDTLCKLAEEGK